MEFGESPGTLCRSGTWHYASRDPQILEGAVEMMWRLDGDSPFPSARVKRVTAWARDPSLTIVQICMPLESRRPTAICWPEVLFICGFFRESLGAPISHVVVAPALLVLSVIRLPLISSLNNDGTTRTAE